MAVGRTQILVVCVTLKNIDRIALLVRFDFSLLTVIADVSQFNQLILHADEYRLFILLSPLHLRLNHIFNRLLEFFSSNNLISF